MDKNKLIGFIAGVLLAILGSFGVINSETVKGEICGVSAPAAVAK